MFFCVFCEIFKNIIFTEQSENSSSQSERYIIISVNKKSRNSVLQQPDAKYCVLVRPHEQEFPIEHCLKYQQSDD